MRGECGWVYGISNLLHTLSDPVPCFRYYHHIYRPPRTGGSPSAGAATNRGSALAGRRIARTLPVAIRRGLCRGGRQR